MTLSVLPGWDLYDTTLAQRIITTNNGSTAVDDLLIDRDLRCVIVLARPVPKT